MRSINSNNFKVIIGRLKEVKRHSNKENFIVGSREVEKTDA